MFIHSSQQGAYTWCLEQHIEKGCVLEHPGEQSNSRLVAGFGSHNDPFTSGSVLQRSERSWIMVEWHPVLELLLIVSAQCFGMQTRYERFSL